MSTGDYWPDPDTADVGSPFARLVADMTRNIETSPFAKSQTVAQWATAIREELAEFEEAYGLAPYKNGAVDAADAELGDVIWNLISMALAYERQGGRSLKEVLDVARTKFRLRKPWIFDGSVAPATPAEEVEMFKARKAQLKGRIR